MKKERSFFEKHQNIITDSICVLFLILSVLALFSYYYNIYSKLVDILIILIVIILGIDCLLFNKKLKKHHKQYKILAVLFFIVGLTHFARFIFGPLHCRLFPYIFSLYLYELFAFIVGFLLFY